MDKWPNNADIRKFLLRHGVAAAARPFKVTRIGEQKFKANWRVNLRHGRNAEHIRFNFPSRDTAFESQVTYKALQLLESANVMGVAKPVGLWSKHKAVAYYEMPGIKLTKVLQNRDIWTPSLAKLCQWLLDLEHKHLPGPRHLPAGWHEQELAWWKLNFSRVKDAEQVMKLGKKLLTARRRWQVGIRRSLVHGDLNPDNVLLAGKKLAVIDFGNAYHGDPMADWGGLLAQLYAFIIQHKIIGSAKIGERIILAHLPRQARVRSRLYTEAAWQSLKAAAYLADTRIHHRHTAELLRLAQRFANSI